MAIYRFETECGGELTATQCKVYRRSTGDWLANSCFVTEETAKRLLGEIEANEGGGKGELVDLLKECQVELATVIGYRQERRDKLTARINAILKPVEPPERTEPEPPAEPKPVWQGAGWYEVQRRDEPVLLVVNRGGNERCVVLRGEDGYWHSEEELIRCIRPLTADELLAMQGPDRIIPTRDGEGSRDEH